MLGGKVSVEGKAGDIFWFPGAIFLEMCSSRKKSKVRVKNLQIYGDSWSSHIEKIKSDPWKYNYYDPVDPPL